MAIKEKVTRDELILYELLKHPVLCGEFIRNIDLLPQEEEFEYTFYQKEFLCDFANNVSICCGRAVGKTLALSDMITWAMINNIFPGDYINYHVPGKAHAEPVFTTLVKMFRTNSLLKNFIPKKTGINRSDLIIEPLTASSLMCRIAGQTNTGVSVVGLHSPLVIVDEGGYYPYGTWTELHPTVNTFTPGHRLIVSGVPTGLRENNVLYETDMKVSSYTKHRISALQNPRFTEEDKQKAIEMYGGEDSEDYVHLVLGQHGKPVFSLFDRANMSIEGYPVYKMILDGNKLKNNIVEYINKLTVFPGLSSQKYKAIFGIDLGYTQPTAIVVMYIDTLGRIKFHGRIQLNKVNFFLQEKIIDWLDTKFEPIMIGIDEGAGGGGTAVVPRLREHEDFIHKNYKDRLSPINFSSNIVLGKDSEGNEISSKTKPFAVSTLQEYTNNHRIIFSSTDLELITELERMTYTKTPTGNIVYRTLTDRGGKKGEDHFTSALLCGILAYHLEIESIDFKPKTKKLFQPRWNI